MDNTSSSSPYASAVPQLRFGKIDDLTSRVAAAVDGARKFLFSDQHEEGYWCGELEADTTLESDYILLHTLLGTGDRAPSWCHFPFVMPRSLSRKSRRKWEWKNSSWVDATSRACTSIGTRSGYRGATFSYSSTA